MADMRLSEDDLTEALRWAKSRLGFIEQDEGLLGERVRDRPEAARALLDLARLVARLEHVAGECPACEGFYCGDVTCPDYGVTEHKADCPIDLVVRAAQRAGLRDD